MECFNTLLLKLRESHEREVEGWQVKIQELSNKKGCDTKRMEELFTKNQQMKEQQRILTENIKTLENRLRAGLCDRCTVTQEVAKRKQHEFEASQMQSFHHISLLAGEINNLKKENRRLKDEVKTLRAALHCTPADVKPNRSPDFAASSGAVALVTSAASIAGSQPADGDPVTMKSEEEQRAEDGEHKQWRGNRKYFDSYKPLSTPSPWKTEHSGSYRGERRVQSVDGLDQQSSTSPHAVLKSSLSSGGEVNHSRHVLHAPVPCRPQPIKSSPVALPWGSSPAASQVLQTAKPHLPRFANLTPAGQHDNPKRQGFGQSWHKQSAPKSSATEPTVLFRLKSLSEHMESQSKPQERKEASPVRVERVSAGGPSEVFEGPLDLSDRGKSKSSQSPTDFLPLALEREQNSPDEDVKNKPSTHGSLSPRCGISSSSSPRPTVKQPEGESGSENETKQIVKEQKQKEEVNGKADQSGEEKVPVLTISLRPVVMLETLNLALQKQESLTSNEKSPVPTAESESSADDQENVQSGPGEERKLGCKRKRTPVETESDKDMDMDSIQSERKLKITMRAEERSPSLGAAQ